MSDDNFDLLIEDIASASYELGIWTGLQQAGEQLRVESGELYAADRFDDAEATRRLSKKLIEQAKQQRTKYDSTYKPRRDAAWKRLEELQAKQANHNAAPSR